VAFSDFLLVRLFFFVCGRQSVLEAHIQVHRPYRYVFQIFFYLLVEMIPLFLIVFFLVHIPKSPAKKPLMINQLRYGELQDSV